MRGTNDDDEQASRAIVELLGRGRWWAQATDWRSCPTPVGARCDTSHELHRPSASRSRRCIWVDSRRPGPSDAQDPALNTGHRALGRCQVRLQVPRKLPGPVGFTEPRRHREGVVLVGRAVIRGKGVLPKRRVDLDDGGLSRGVDQPSKGQKCRRLPSSLRRFCSQGMPAWVDLATEPLTSKWNTDLAEPARCSVIRRQRVLPVRAAPLPARPSRTKST